MPSTNASIDCCIHRLHNRHHFTCRDATNVGSRSQKLTGRIELGGFVGVGSSAFCCESSQRIGEIIEMMDSLDGAAAADAMQELRGVEKWWCQCLASVCVYGLEGGHSRCW
jgi:hypothetical protein